MISIFKIPFLVILISKIIKLRDFAHHLHFKDIKITSAKIWYT